MTTEEILRMSAGPDLDAAVHKIALNRPGKPAAYSTKDSAAMLILQLLPLIGGRLPTDAEGRDPQRPFIAGEVAWNAARTVCEPKFTVTAASLPVALCKAALIHATGQRTQVRGSSAPLPRVGSASRLTPEPIPTRSDTPRLATPIDIPGDRRTE